MKALIAFTRKELVEQCKNYKFLIIGGLLLAFGMTSPLLAKMMPDIFSQLDMGMEFTIPDPTFVDAYAQFFKNMTQICVIASVLVFSGNITQEIQRGTALMLFSKGLSRTSFLFSKFLAMTLVWTAGYALSALACWGYTLYLFPGQSPSHLLFSLFCLWLLVEFFLAAVVLGSVLFAQTFAAMLTAGGAAVLLFLVQIFPKAARFLPLYLGSGNMNLITGTQPPAEFLPAVWITAGLTLLFLAGAAALFRKKQL